MKVEMEILLNSVREERGIALANTIPGLLSALSL